MTDVTIHSGGLRPLDGAIVQRLPVAATVTLAAPAVILDEDGVSPTADDAAQFDGVVVATERKTASAAAGEHVTVATFGRVAGFSGLTPGAVYYLSGTDGKIATTGTVPVGRAESAEVMFIMARLTGGIS